MMTFKEKLFETSRKLKIWIEEDTILMVGAGLLLALFVWILYLVVKVILPWMPLILLVLVAFWFIYFKSSLHVFYYQHSSKCIEVVIDRFRRTKLIKTSRYDLKSETGIVRVKWTLQNAQYRIDLGSNDIDADSGINNEYLTYLAQQAWNDFLKDNVLRATFSISYVSIEQHDYHTSLLINLENKRHLKMLNENDILNDKDDDF